MHPLSPTDGSSTDFVPDTIFALSSGLPPAAIGVIRISGPSAGIALQRLTGSMPPARRAVLRDLRDGNGDLLDSALVLYFPGPASATGEDCAELQCHGGRAVVSAVTKSLAQMTGLREAQPGEFTRRAFANGRIDLAQAEGLADLLSAETEMQRLAAQAGAGGALSRKTREWRDTVLKLAAEVELVLDFADEDDAQDLSAAFWQRLEDVRADMREWLERPRAEILREGIRVVLAGPPNAGKSSLFNALVQDGAAIVSPVAGTTRDAIERSIAFSGIPFVLVDTAGLRDESDDPVETIGIDRAKDQLKSADIVLWLGSEGQGPADAIEIQSRADASDCVRKSAPDHTVSAVTGLGVRELERDLIERARLLLPKAGSAALNARQATLVGQALESLQGVCEGEDGLLVGESLRQARVCFDRLLGQSSTEDMLDQLFGRFCIGK
ncbi:tRNA uridine-5-carboxymethylaminomethyl(34) synthesis GTPase MnmE [Porphyrobacter algicida]|uniref:tRNA modification GTPase MnmE n=1 Tax=Qipengyuania algicida TaxID=1836209 RepID=A0A845AFM3_9SPHN|nr:tRNA uridine-5-carboxymethylaminomethyl(34) synthesis GTPase MnmE [Qipengyuania algicida]MXP28023.1 tRNA uridine-5-carboxymethylaminomethyl(34) synthesis GTPase MnmE [Qipengyuania algicida]